jgi:hypothetical protein
MKQTELMKNSLPLIAAGLGDKLGIRVTVSGNQAWTDNQTINIPDFQISSKEEKNAVLGFVSHEAAHLKFDSFKGLNTFQFKHQLHHAMWNIFEDLRIEKAMIESMIGTKNWINQIWLNRQKDGQRQPVTSQSAPASIVVDYLLFHCRVRYRKQIHLQPYLDAAEEAFIEVLSWQLLSKIQQCMDKELADLASSKDAYNLATKVEAIISNHEPEEEEPEQEPESQEEEDSSESESNPGESGDSSSETSEHSDNDDSEQSDDSTSGSEESDDESNSEETQGDGQGNDSGTGQSGTESEDNTSGSSQDTTSGNLNHSSKGTGQEPSSQQVLAAIASALDADKEELKDDMEQFAEQMATLANANPEQSRVMMPDAQKVETKPGSGAALVKTVKQTSNALSIKLTGLVQENMRVRAKTATRGTRLNNKVLYRASVGDPRLFKTKTIQKEINTIVEIQLDNSASMINHGPLLRTAKEAQVALALALSRINGVSVTASAFPATPNGNDVLELLSEGESVKKLSDRLHSAHGQGWHTPSATAMWHSIKKVMESNQSRKVILFITDGEPNYAEREPLARLVSKAERSGIIVIGIAIGDIAHTPHEFRHFFSNALFIQDIKELKTEIFKVAQDILLS